MKMKRNALIRRTLIIVLMCGAVGFLSFSCMSKKESPIRNYSDEEIQSAIGWGFDKDNDLYLMTDWRDVTRDHLLVTFFYDFKLKKPKDDAVQLKKCLEKGMQVNNYYGTKGNAPSLLDSHVGENGTTLLLLALRNNAVDCVRTLLSQGAASNWADAEGNTPYMFLGFCKNSYARELRKVWESQFDVNATNMYGQTALYFSVKAGNLQDVLDLIDRGARLDVQDKNTRSLWFDVINAEEPIFRTITEYYNFDQLKESALRLKLLLELKPQAAFYEKRFDYLMTPGCSDLSKWTEENLLIANMRALGDCPERLSFLLKYSPLSEQVSDAFRYAEHKNLSRSFAVIQDYLGRCK